MSANEEKGGGEVGGARLLRLARRDLLDSVLPYLEGDARYRARLIANAMKIAARELDDGTAAAAATSKDLQAFTGTALGSTAATPAEAAAAIRDGLREGRLDADTELFRLLRELTGRRRDLLA